MKTSPDPLLFGSNDNGAAVHGGGTTTHHMTKIHTLKLIGTGTRRTPEAAAPAETQATELAAVSAQSRPL